MTTSEKEYQRKYHREWYLRNRERILEKSREWYENNKERAFNNMRNYATKDKEKKAARKELYYLLERGVIVRSPCEICENPKSEAHHDDYSKPDQVRWLCKKHHAEYHRLQRALLDKGVSNGIF